MADASSTAKKIKDEEIKFVDLRFTDPRGKMQHVTMDASLMDEEALAEGVMFDVSALSALTVTGVSGSASLARLPPGFSYARRK